jgi:hypothetical protein
MTDMNDIGFLILAAIGIVTFVSIRDARKTLSLHREEMERLQKSLNVIERQLDMIEGWVKPAPSVRTPTKRLPLPD